jgi:hypothetical protein
MGFHFALWQLSMYRWWNAQIVLMIHRYMMIMIIVFYFCWNYRCFTWQILGVITDRECRWTISSEKNWVLGACYSANITSDGYKLFSAIVSMMFFSGVLKSLAGPAPNYDCQRKY